MKAAAHTIATGIGIYTIPEASHLIGEKGGNTSRIRRWLRGYRFPCKSGEYGESKPVFQTQLPKINNQEAIGFLDLIELLFIRAFRDEGVSLQYIRLAAKKASERWKTDHPFCLRKFATNGREIFATIQQDEGDEQLVELVKSQYAFKAILNPFLKQLDFSKKGNVYRWWPLGRTREVCLDPNISFGRAIVHPYAIPTETLYLAVQANQSEKEVAQWYDVPMKAVRSAVEFEKNRAA